MSLWQLGIEVSTNIQLYSSAFSILDSTTAIGVGDLGGAFLFDKAGSSVEGEWALAGGGDTGLDGVWSSLLILYLEQLTFSLFTYVSLVS